MGTQTPTNCQHRVDGGVLNPKEKDKKIILVIFGKFISSFAFLIFDYYFYERFN
ncbi:hypothetical protein CYANOKiyG1_61280 [Okeania sp. KiyG1]|nr:hypothetical protein CYANOKiyG1_61280 [Okeania sp. KiyG1]